MLTFIGKLRGVGHKLLSSSLLGERRQLEPVAGESVRQAEGELCHVGIESLQMDAAAPGAVDWTHNGLVGGAPLTSAGHHSLTSNWFGSSLFDA